MTRTKSTYLALLAVLLSPMAANAIPIIINGSFTGPTALGSLPTGWSIFSETPDTNSLTDYLGGIGTFGATPSGASPDGDTWAGLGIDLGISFFESFGQIVTDFDVGTEYELSWFGANFGSTGNFFTPFTATNAINVRVDGLSVGTGSSLALGSDWFSQSVLFTATSMSHQLSFSLASGARSYLSIDGVCITEVGSTDRGCNGGGDNDDVVSVPEPSTLALLGIGLFGMGLARRRRKV